MILIPQAQNISPEQKQLNCLDSPVLARVDLSPTISPIPRIIAMNELRAAGKRAMDQKVKGQANNVSKGRKKLSELLDSSEA